MAEDDYTGDIGSQVELSNDGVPMRWYHQQEHDYLKNEVEPESSGMEDVDDVSLENEGEVVSEITEEYSEPLAFGNTHHIVNNASRLNEASTRINTYDSELPQEIFQKPQDIASTYQTSSGNVLVGNYVQQQDSSLVVRQVIDPVPARFNASVIMQEEQSDRSNYHDNFMMEEAEMEDSRSYHGELKILPCKYLNFKLISLSEEIHMNVAKNVKLLAYPSAIKYNDKYIIEEVSFILLAQISFHQIFCLISRRRIFNNRSMFSHRSQAFEQTVMQACNRPTLLEERTLPTFLKSAAKLRQLNQLG